MKTAATEAATLTHRVAVAQVVEEFDSKGDLVMYVQSTAKQYQ
jgi:hypothetical protein